jgi:hypothetical protein
MKKLKKYIAFVTLAAVILSVVILPQYAKAFSNKSQENIFIAENELVPYNFVAVAGTIDFQGEAQKDIIVAGGDVSISGPVHGDVIVGGGNVRIAGNVDGNVRAIGGTVEINGKVGKNVTIAGGNITLGPASEVGWDVMIGGGNVISKGKIAGNINAGAGSLTLGGEVGGDIEAYIGQEGYLNILPNAKVDGKLVYWSVSEATVPEGAVINGEVKHNSTLEQFMKERQERFVNIYIFGIIVSILATIIIGLVIVKLFPDKTLSIINKMTKHPFLSLGWGIVYLVIVPIISFLFLIFVVTIPLAIIIMLFYGLAIYLAKLFVAVLIGQQIYKYYKKTSQKEDNSDSDQEGANRVDLVRPMILGVVVYILIVNIPFVGWLASFLGIIWALGAVGRATSEWIERRVKR